MEFKKSYIGMFKVKYREGLINLPYKITNKIFMNFESDLLYSRAEIDFFDYPFIKIHDFSLKKNEALESFLLKKSNNLFIPRNITKRMSMLNEEEFFVFYLEEVIELHRILDFYLYSPQNEFIWRETIRNL
ncbi:MAG: hypothetical protein QXG18_00040 [Candidatus Pacearchaeota archaeon]